MLRGAERVASVLMMLAAATAHAHLMVAQHGTINVVGESAFIVVSLPAAAFPQADDSGDGRLSIDELRAHQDAVLAGIRVGVQLLDAQGPRPLDGLMLSLTPPDEAPTQPAAHVVALGRFVLDPAQPPTSLSLRISLFGRDQATQSLQITATRGDEKQWLTFSPEAPVAALFSSKLSVFFQSVMLGTQHIVFGIDHLLFLLVVLAAGGGVRHTLLTLSCFTLGHAVTLAISIFGNLHAPPALVEPAIAATIVLMAIVDWRSKKGARVMSPATRLALVFGCALIHGLGLATSLQAIGFSSADLVPVVAGFNLGVELAQIAAALAILAGASLVQRWLGTAMLDWPRRITQLGSVCAGTVWFFTRVLS